MKATIKTRALCVWILKCIFVYPFKLTALLIRCGIIPLIHLIKTKTNSAHSEDYEDNEEEYEEQTQSLEGCPEFSEIFTLNDTTIIGVEYVARIPDETAFVRIVTDESYSKQFKRRVFSTKGFNNEKYIKVDDNKFFLRKTTTTRVP